MTILSYLPQWGWTQMPEWVAPVARVFFWVFLSAMVIILVFIFWGILCSLIPVRIKFESKRKPQIDNSKNSGMIDLHQEQVEHEEQWLRPVIEWIDLNRAELPKNQIIVKYQIDSGLTYDFKPYRMWIKLRIGQYESKDGWEILQTPNLLKGKRSQFASETFTINDERLLKKVDKCRQGAKVAQTVKIIAQLRDQEELRELGQSYSINPYPEYLQEI